MTASEPTFALQRKPASLSRELAVTALRAVVATIAPGYVVNVVNDQAQVLDAEDRPVALYKLRQLQEDFKSGFVTFVAGIRSDLARDHA